MTNSKKSGKPVFKLQIILLIVFIIFVLGLTLRKKSSTGLPSSNIVPTTPVITPTLILEKRLVKYVIDGDTIVLADNSKVRYIGINTPELDNYGKVDCFAQNAKNFNRQLVENQIVSLEKDVSDKDKYGRLLRFVYLDGILINEMLVSQGFARTDLIPPDTKYAAIFQQAENDAKKDVRGLWKECKNID